jgi:hypothetical protein
LNKGIGTQKNYFICCVYAKGLCKLVGGERRKGIFSHVMDWKSRILLRRARRAHHAATMHPPNMAKHFPLGRKH